MQIQPGDTELIELALQNDRWAYEMLFNRYQDLAFTLAMKLSGNNKELSEEIIQDSFLKAFQNLRNFKKEARFSTWLYRIVFSTAMDALKGRKKAISLEYVATFDDEAEYGDPSMEGPLTLLEKDDLKNKIAAALSKLPEADNLILTFVYLQGESLEDIAHILKTDRNTVKVRLFRARQKLKKILSGEVITNNLRL